MAARLVVLGVILLDVEENDLAAGKFKFKRDLDEPVEAFAHLRLLFRRHEQQNESAAARAQQLAAEGARLPRVVIQGIHAGVGNLVAQAALGLPRLVQQFAEGRPIPTAAQNLAALVHALGHFVQQRGPFLHAAGVAGGDIRRRALDAGVKQHQVGVQLREPVRGDGHRLDAKIPVLQKADAVHAAVGRADLVLRADGLLQHVLLDVNALRSQLLFADGASLQRVERVEQADGERRTRPHAAAPRQIAVVVDFHPAFHFQIAQGFARGRVLNFVQCVAILNLGIHHTDAVLEKRRQIAAAEVAILVDGGRQHRAAVLAIPRRIIRPAAEK